MSDDAVLWMFIRTDFSGNTFLIKDGMSQEEAVKARSDLLAKHHKPHGQDYDICSYTAATRAALIAARKIICT